jgi:hexosaminidase
MDPTRNSTYEFLNKFIAEMVALFPDKHFHIGGDECNGKQWDSNPRIQAFMRNHGLKNNAALQAYFTAKVQKILAAHGKIMVGWDEVLQPNTSKNVVIQSWRGQLSLANAARRGYRGILSTGYYIDLNQPAAEHYAVEPFGEAAEGLSEEEKQNILGGEAAMWTVFETSENIDTHIWPRTAAIAERLWSPQDVRNVDSMYCRLAQVSQTLNYYNLQHNLSYPAMLRRITGNPDPVQLRVLSNVMQPVEFHTREDSGHYDAFTPLNRLVDALPPESDTARHFLHLVSTLVSGHPTQEDWEEARRWLVLWRDNDTQLQPMLSRSQLTQELIPVSSNLRQVAEIGLNALDYLRNHRAPPVEWRTQQLAFLETSAQPQADLLNMVAPAVTKLVQATAQ